jgi:hypothetical protein
MPGYDLKRRGLTNLIRTKGLSVKRIRTISTYTVVAKKTHFFHKVGESGEKWIFVFSLAGEFRK